MRLGRDFTIAEPARARATRPSSSASACRRGASSRSPAPRPTDVYRRHGVPARLQRRQADAARPAHRRDRRRQRRLRRGALGAAPGRGGEPDEALRTCRGDSRLRRGPLGAAAERRQGSPRRLPREPRGDAGRRDRDRSRAREEGIQLHNRRGPSEVVRENGKRHGAAHRSSACRSSTRSGRFKPDVRRGRRRGHPGRHRHLRHRPDARTSPSSPPEDGVEIDARPHQGESRDLSDHRARRLRLRRHRARAAALHRRHRLGPDRGALACTTTCAAPAPTSSCASSWSPAAYTMAEGWDRMERAESAGARERAAAPRRSRSSRSAIPEAEARRQAARCLRCNVNTVFDTAICIACNGCVDVCPENLIQLVGLSRWSTTGRGCELAQRRVRHRRAGGSSLAPAETRRAGRRHAEGRDAPASAARCAPRAARRTPSR